MIRTDNNKMELSQYFMVLFLFSLIDQIQAKDLEYDFIIIGGGTAGCVVASRLSENVNHSVLVLEAGPWDDEYPAVAVPLNAAQLSHTLIDWNYTSYTQKYSAFALNDQKYGWSQAKIMGGCSSHNFLDYIRGSPHDFDYWSELGNEGWSYKEVLPYFKKMENMRDPDLQDPIWHGQSGPLDIETPEKYKTDNMVESLMQGLEELGLRRRDVNGEDNLGFSLAQHNTRFGRRMNTAAAYIRPFKSRRNLHVTTGAHVAKILFNGNTAIGVSYIKDGRSHSAKARKEIILSAGALSSPKILMLSGVGPRAHLEEFSIPVISDLPVGNVLEDHPSIVISYSVNISTTFTPADYELWRYVLMGKGALVSSTAMLNAFMASVHQPTEHKFPYIQWIFYPGLPGFTAETSKNLRDLFGYNKSFWDPVYLNQRNKPGYFMITPLLHVESIGSVKLRSTDPMDDPLFDVEYFTNDQNIQHLIYSIRMMQALVKTESLRSIGANIIDPHQKGCEKHIFDTDDYWECYIRHNAISLWHYTSSCKMANDTTGVVDNRLRVKGVKNLRVVDASIMPHMTSGNTMTPTIMIAEKAADMIKQDIF